MNTKTEFTNRIFKKRQQLSLTEAGTSNGCPGLRSSSGFTTSSESRHRKSNPTEPVFTRRNVAVHTWLNG